MPNPRDQRLAQLAAIAQLFGTMQQAQGQSQQNALGQAQLQQTGQFHQGELQQALAALQQQGQWHQGELGNQQAQLQELSRYHSGELQNQQAAQALAGKQGDAQLAELQKYHQGELESHKASEANRTKMEFMQHFLADPNAGNWEQKVQALGSLDPSFLPMGQAMHEGGVNSMMQKRLPEVQGMYDQYNKGHDYSKLAEGLKVLQPTIPQESWDRMPWDQMNQGMTQGTAPTSWFGGGSPAPAPQDIPADLQGAFGLEQQKQQQEQAQNLQLQQQAAEAKKRRDAELYLRKQAYDRVYGPSSFGSQVPQAF